MGFLYISTKKRLVYRKNHLVIIRYRGSFMSKVVFFRARYVKLANRKKPGYLTSLPLIRTLRGSTGYLALRGSGYRR
jgi:hypothetical protein